MVIHCFWLFVDELEVGDSFRLKQKLTLNVAGRFEVQIGEMGCLQFTDVNVHI